MDTPTRELVPAEPQHLALLQNLFQLYIYDFSEMVPNAVGDDGRFPLTRPLSEYWRDAWRHPFLLRVGGRWAGFALVDHRSRLDDDPDVWDMAQFFVMRAHRRSGVGQWAAAALFDRFRGRWEVRQIPANLDATRFWRKAIDRYTRGAFSERTHVDARWSGTVQSFTSAR